MEQDRECVASCVHLSAGGAPSSCWRRGRMLFSRQWRFPWLADVGGARHSRSFEYGCVLHYPGRVCVGGKPVKNSHLAPRPRAGVDAGGPAGIVTAFD